MATTIASVRTPANITIAVADTLTRVDLPAAAKKFSIQPRTNSAKLLWAGTDNAAIGAAAYMTIQANSIVEIDVTSGQSRALGGQSIYVTSATPGTVIEIVAEE